MFSGDFERDFLSLLLQGMSVPAPLLVSSQVDEL